MDFKALAEAALEERARLVNEMRSVNEDANLSDAEKRERIERINADVEAKTAEARGYIEQGEREAEARSLAARAGGLIIPGVPEGDQKRGVDLNAVFREIALGDRREFVVEAEDRAALEVAFRNINAAGSVTGTANNAGTLVGNTFMTELLAAFRETSAVLQAGPRLVTTATGEKLEWPFKSGNIAASAVAEGVTYPRSNATFTRVTLNSFKYGVIAEASYEMVQDSALPLGSIIAEDIGAGIGDQVGAKLISGNGTTEPQGIVTGTTLNSTLANQAAITTDALVTHQHKITPKYRRNAKWVVSDSFVLAVRLLKDGNGRYVWQDGITAGAPSTLLGKEVIVDPFMDASTGAGTPAVFGDFAKGFVVRMVNGINVTRSDEYGWQDDVIAWKGNVRLDSGVVDAAATAKVVLSA